jgi:hypothetical protein
MTATMAPQLSPEEIDRLARKRASAKLGWYTHACVYVVVNAFWLLSSYFGIGMHRWNVFPSLGWGLGLALHFISVFVLGKGSGLRESMVERERDRIQRQQNRL